MNLTILWTNLTIITHGLLFLFFDLVHVWNRLLYLYGLRMRTGYDFTETNKSIP